MCDLDGIAGRLGPEQLLINDGTGHFTDGSNSGENGDERVFIRRVHGIDG